MTQPLATFQVDMVDTTYTVTAIGEVTRPLRWRGQAIAGWGMPNTEFSEPTNMGLGVPGNPYTQLVALYDAFGNPYPSFTSPPWQNGHIEGLATFRILGSQVPGGNTVDCVLRATTLSGSVSGTGQWCHVTINAVIPPAVHTYGITSNGQSLGNVPAADPVVITRDGAVIWQSGPYTNPITGGRTGELVMLKANAGFARFTPPAADPVTGVVPLVVFQVGMRTGAPQSISAPLPNPFTAFQCSANDAGDIQYDTVVYISNRNAHDIQVAYKITNAENGQNVADSFVVIGPWKMLAFSSAGALK